MTKPFLLEGDSLSVNVDASAGSVRVEVLDADGAPFPAWSGTNAMTQKAVDELSFTPVWQAKKNLADLKGKVVRLRFSLQNARLYAFRIQ